jgi:hypothetical protein
MANTNLRNANKAKKDEFYTQYADIERECEKYREQFAGKVIYCDCDDPVESNFFKYFANNFDFFGLKKLITTHFDADKPTYKLELDRKLDLNDDGKIDIADVEKTPLKGNGDFRNAECIELLKEADIVITNPPFSLFREYLAQLMEYEKKFLIIGNTNSLTYKEVFKLFKEDKIRTGYTNFNVGMHFVVPKTWEKYHKIDENGNKLVRVATSCWLTNLEVAKHHDDIILYEKYIPEKYPKYDNYDAINVDKYTDIPQDYVGEIGVPITFLDKYNPSQFEIIKFRKGDDEKDLVYTINGEQKYPYFRVIIKRKEKA